MTVVFLVNGDAGSAMGDRAQALADRLSEKFRAVLAYRTAGRAGAAGEFTAALHAARPDVVYVMDLAVAGVAAAAAWRLRHRVRVIVDTGDAITELARSAGRSRAGVAATALLEAAGMRLADHVVVRGTGHRDLLADHGRSVTVIQDGVDLQRFHPVDPLPARAALGLSDELVIGVLGSCTWSSRLGIAYGWDLVEALGMLRELPVKGLLIGDGSGVAHLRDRARALGVDDRLVLAGRRPLDELPALLSACDVCLSTQTNDVVGNVRTTGKLPLYLACGRFVLATAVGEAARVLPEDMLLPYEGVVDLQHPGRLAARVREIKAGSVSHSAERSVAIARRHFDYDVLAARLETMLTTSAAALAPRDAAARA
jgi:glycosyltransferase involved in cell wall biosynthesis